MIEKLLFNSRTSEVNEAVNGILKEWQMFGLPTNTYLSEKMEHLNQDNTALSAAIKRIKTKSDLTKLDQDFDARYRDLWYLIVGAMHHPEQTIRTAAEKIFVVLSNYGLDLVNENYASEMAHTRSLLTDLAAPALQESIAAINGCAAAIANIQSAYDAFESAIKEFNNSIASEQNYTSATDLKKQIARELNNEILVVLDGLKITHPDEYGTLISHIEQLISRNNSNVRRRMN